VTRVAEISRTRQASDELAEDRRGGGRVGQVGLFGGPLDTGNNGVSALGLGTIAGFARLNPPPEVTMFDYGRGARRASVGPEVGGADLDMVGCYPTRRFYARECLQQVRLAAFVGWHRQPVLRRLASLNALCDISGGDSFSDIYGERRFWDVAGPKQLAIQLSIPLVLLPQTYGPFTSPVAKKVAAEILSGATQVWARDPASLGIVAELLGPRFDPKKHKQGIDVAFGLPAKRPENEIGEVVASFRRRFGILVGVNISGLLYGDKAGGQRFGLLEDYAQVIRCLVRALLDVDGLGVMLVPHVYNRDGHADCDAAACAAAYGEVPSGSRERVLLIPPGLGPMESKSLIGQCDWFCGTRMHACIAAISQAIPAAALAYSDKTAGVFEAAGVGDCVVDLRKPCSRDVVHELMSVFGRREHGRELLLAGMGAWRRELSDQFILIARAWQ
jgi:colanic acid/amylovoran biosynthesis protein